MSKKQSSSRKPSDQLSQGIPRRDLLRTLKWLGIGVLVGRAGTLTSLEDDWHTICRWGTVLREGVKNTCDRLNITRERIDILVSLFGAGNHCKLHPGAEHKSGVRHYSEHGERKAYPHDQQAINAFALLLPQDSTIEAQEFVEDRLEASDTLVCSGSPVSNEWAGKYLPHWKQTRLDGGPSRCLLRPNHLPYHFLDGDTQQTILVRSGMLGGEIQPKRRHGIVVNDGSSHPQLWWPRDLVSRDGFLARDFLIASRVPRNTAGGEVILISGAHGAGTQAFELLLDSAAFPMEDLRRLQAALGADRYWQFVLEADDILHDLPMTVARRLHLSTDCPPRPVRFDVDLLENEGSTV